MIGYTCEHCGARLDPGERCDCRDVRVVILRTDGSIEISVTDGTLETYQSIVGGHIEHVHSIYPVGLLVNEEGILLGLPSNPFFPRYVGNIIFVKEPEDGGDEFRSFDEYEAEQIVDMLTPGRTA